MISQGVPVQLVIPKEGAVLGIVTIAIFKGSKKADLAYNSSTRCFDPGIQSEAAKLKKASLSSPTRSSIRRCQAPRRVHHA